MGEEVNRREGGGGEEEGEGELAEQEGEGGEAFLSVTDFSAAMRNQRKFREKRKDSADYPRHPVIKGRKNFS